MKRLIFTVVLFYLSFNAFGQCKLSGTVSGKDELLAGASVTLKNTLMGVSTQKDGSFEFKNLKMNEHTIIVSYIGFETREITVLLDKDKKVEITLNPSIMMSDEVIVFATRNKENSPFSFTNVGNKEITRQNSGRDIPYLLQLTPSFVATSDAGSGVGYTSFRIRGTDMNRINITLDGIPLNDSESHGTWFVNMPDLASSLDNIQVQRGVGTSVNGSAAFGATLNMQTNTIKSDPYAEFKTAAGSFNTLKNSISSGTGLINNKFTFDVRLSKINSDGFIDRAFSDLKSFFISCGYHTEKTIVKFNVISGLEKTYQAWNGISSDLLKTNRTYNASGSYFDKSGIEKFYDNQIDHYQQNHYHLHVSHSFSKNLFANAALHHTHGEGYYENLKTDQKLKDYQLPDYISEINVIKKADLVNQKCLDNDLYGLTFSLNYKKNENDFILGGGISDYNGHHFGKVIKATSLTNLALDHEWYRNLGQKIDRNVFTKYSYRPGNKLNLFADLQYRQIKYSITGFDDDLRDLWQHHSFQFFNPKLGVFYQPNLKNNLFVSFSIANREPNRDNFVDTDPNGKKPVKETLYDWESGYHFKSESFTANVNLYYMKYMDQLVLTGEINDVGAPVMMNAANSYRAGIEIQSVILLTKRIQWAGNVTFSRNKIIDFTEYVDNWDTWEQKTEYLGNTDISFSPRVVGNSKLQYSPLKTLIFSLNSAFVGKQFIDNTSNKDRKLDSWFTNQLTASYTIKPGFFDEVSLNLHVNNIFNEIYESNAWVYSYISEGKRTKMDGYFPQAGRNWMLGINFRF